MARNSHPSGPPPTLDDLAQHAVGIDAEYRDCGYRAVMDFELFLERCVKAVQAYLPRRHPSEVSSPRHLLQV